MPSLANFQGFVWKITCHWRRELVPKRRIICPICLSSFGFMEIPKATSNMVRITPTQDSRPIRMTRSLGLRDNRIGRRGAMDKRTGMKIDSAPLGVRPQRIQNKIGWGRLKLFDWRSHSFTFHQLLPVSGVPITRLNLFFVESRA